MIDRSIPKSSILSESPSIGISNPEVHPSIGTSSVSCGCAVLLLRLFLCAVSLLRLFRVTDGSASNTSFKRDSSFKRSKTREIQDFKGSREPFLQKKKREKDVNERS